MRNALWKFRLGHNKLGGLAVCKDGDGLGRSILRKKRCALFAEAMAILNKEGSGVAEKGPSPQTCKKSHVGLS